MKKLSACLALLGLLCLAGAESLTEHQLYQRAQDLSAQAQKAYDEGYYDQAEGLALESEEALAAFDRMVELRLQEKGAKDALASAQERLDWAKNAGVERREPTAYAQARENLESAIAAFNQGDFLKALDLAQLSLASLEGIKGYQALPARYLVTLKPGDRECLWKIAALPFVYNDPYAWEVLYRANKSKLAQPANPNLILPGDVIVIPSLYGEVREGDYDPKAEYEALKKPK